MKTKHQTAEKTVAHVNEGNGPELVSQPLLETKRLILEPYKDSDVEDIFAYASHPEVARYVPWQVHKSLKDSQDFLNYVRASTRLERGKLFFVFAIRLKKSRRVIGSIDFKNISPFAGQIDYALGYESWGQGIMPEAAEALRDWAFLNLPELVRLQAFCVAENRKSARVMEKIGMSREGLRRKAFMLKGQLVDLADYAVIRDGST